ncbi:MAG: ABC transporter substrate-binding protein [Bacteroidota bacterium]
MRSTLRWTSVLAILVILAGCGTAPGEPSSEEPDASAVPVATTSVTGTDGVVVEAPDASRLVTLGGPVTETVYALGLGDNVVGADISSSFPEDVQEKPRMGYFRQSSPEGILSLEPTLVIALDGLGPPTVAEQVRAAGVPVLLVEEAETLDGAQERVRTLGQALGRPDEAAAVLDAMAAGLERAEAARPATPPKALFIYARGAGLVSVSGTGTAAEVVMQLAGAENAVTAFEGFQALTAESAVEAAPDVLVIPARGLESIGGVDGLLAQPGLAQTPAGQNRRVVAVDDALLLGLGPRVGEGVLALAQALTEATADTPVETIDV